jgi:hypothetical protein
MGLAKMAYFIFLYLSTKFGTSVDGYEEIITSESLIEIAEEINGREPIFLCKNVY